MAAACNYIFKKHNKKISVAVGYGLLFPWLLPTTLICYSYRTYFNSESVWAPGTWARLEIKNRRRKRNAALKAKFGRSTPSAEP